MIKKDKLFGLLGPSPDEEDNSFDLNSEYNIDFLKIKMFVKLVEGADEFKKNLNKLNDLNSSMDSLSDNLIFTKSLFYIEEINVDNLHQIPELNDLMILKFTKALQKSIQYFEENEQYEVCVVLFNIEKTLRDIKKSENI